MIGGEGTVYLIIEKKLGLSERMPVKNHYHNGNDYHSALGAWW